MLKLFNNLRDTPYDWGSDQQIRVKNISTKVDWQKGFEENLATIVDIKTREGRKIVVEKESEKRTRAFATALNV